MSARVPVIDLRPAREGRASRRAVAQEIGRACEEIGFLMVTGHGVPRGLIDEADGLSRAFFDLPLEEKLAIEVGRAGAGMRGYRRLGGTNVAGSRGEDRPADLREQLITGPEPVPGDPYYATPGAQRFFRPNVWPARPAGLKAAWGEYYSALSHLAAELMRLMAVSLALPERFFDDKIDRHITNLVAVNYPDQDAEPLPGQLRAGAHTDFGSLTLLATDGAPGGLQVMMPGGDWADIRPVPGAFIVNLGDLMAQWTNDRWRSTLHRVVNPPRDLARRSRRHSLVFFHQPNHDAAIECLAGCRPADAPARYQPVTSGEHLALQIARINARPQAPQPAPA